MYPNLRAEMSRYRITNEELAKALNRGVATMSMKLNKKLAFSLDEAVAVKKYIKEKGGADIPLEVLFEEAV